MLFIPLLKNIHHSNFTTLVLDWSARIELPPEVVTLAPGTYELIRLDEGVFACRGGEKWLVGDVGCRVVVAS